MAGNPECKICGVSLPEKLFRAHARKEHDLSIFMCMNPTTDIVEDYQGKVKKLVQDTQPKARKPKKLGYAEWVKQGRPDDRQWHVKSVRDLAVYKDDEINGRVGTSITVTITETPQEAPPQEGDIWTDPASGEMWQLVNNEWVECALPAVEEEPAQPVEEKPLAEYSYSQVAAYLSCSHKWDLAFNQDLAPKKEKECMQLGTLVHIALAAAFEAYFISNENPAEYIDFKQKESINEAIQDYFDKFYDEETGEYDLLTDEIEETQRVAQTALNLARGAYAELIAKFEPVVVDGRPLVEYRFKLGLGKLGNYNGAIDLIARERSTGHVWLIDHKVRNRFTTLENEEYNLQMASYQYVLKKLGIKTVGSLTYQIFSALPSIPKLNKPKPPNKEDMARIKMHLQEGTAEITESEDGIYYINGCVVNPPQMSVALCKTTWEVYAQACIDNGLDPKDYEAEMKPKLRDVAFYAYSKAYRKEKEINNSWNDIIMVAIRDMDRRSVTVRSMNTFQCPGCPYNRVCMEDLRGGDVEYIIKEEYQRNEYLHKYKENNIVIEDEDTV